MNRFEHGTLAVHTSTNISVLSEQIRALPPGLPSAWRYVGEVGRIITVIKLEALRWVRLETVLVQAGLLKIIADSVAGVELARGLAAVCTPSPRPDAGLATL
jgi:hypothetical protein